MQLKILNEIVAFKCEVFHPVLETSKHVVIIFILHIYSGKDEYKM